MHNYLQQRNAGQWVLIFLLPSFHISVSSKQILHGRDLTQLLFSFAACPLGTKGAQIGQQHGIIRRRSCLLIYCPCQSPGLGYPASRKKVMPFLPLRCLLLVTYLSGDITIGQKLHTWDVEIRTKYLMLVMPLHGKQSAMDFGYPARQKEDDTFLSSRCLILVMCLRGDLLTIGQE